MPVLIKAYKDLAIDDESRRSPALPLIHQLIHGGRICLNVLAHVRNPFLLKKLFSVLTIPSTRLMVKDNLFSHELYLRSLISKSLNQIIEALDDQVRLGPKGV